MGNVKWAYRKDNVRGNNRNKNCIKNWQIISLNFKYFIFKLDRKLKEKTKLDKLELEKAEKELELL